MSMLKISNNRFCLLASILFNLIGPKDFLFEAWIVTDRIKSIKKFILNSFMYNMILMKWDF